MERRKYADSVLSFSAQVLGSLGKRMLFCSLFQGTSFNEHDATVVLYAWSGKGSGMFVEEV